MSGGWAAFWILLAWFVGGWCGFLLAAASLAFGDSCVFFGGCDQCRAIRSAQHAHQWSANGCVCVTCGVTAQQLAGEQGTATKSALCRKRACKMTTANQDGPAARPHACAQHEADLGASQERVKELEAQRDRLRASLRDAAAAFRDAANDVAAFTPDRMRDVLRKLGVAFDKQADTASGPPEDDVPSGIAIVHNPAGRLP